MKVERDYGADDPLDDDRYPDPAHARFHDLAAIGMLEVCCATSLHLLCTRRGDRLLNTAVAAILPAASPRAGGPPDGPWDGLTEWGRG